MGEFRDDKRSGYGTFTWSNGETYVGEFSHNKRNGKGVRYSVSGAIIEQGLWKDGELVEEADVQPPEPRSASASAPVVAPASKPSSLPPSAPAPAPKPPLASDPEKRCREQAENARTEQLGRIGAFSSKVLPNYDQRTQNCYALVTIMPKGQPSILFIESLVDAAFNEPLAKIEHRRDGAAIGVITDKKYQSSGPPSFKDVQSYIDEKMNGKR